MIEESKCFFRATESAAILDINVSSRVAGAITYDYARQAAGSSQEVPVIRPAF